MIFDQKNKTITTERLFLRMFQKSDAADVAKLCNNYNIYKKYFVPALSLQNRRCFIMDEKPS